MLMRPFGSTGVSLPVIGHGTYGMGGNQRSRKDESLFTIPKADRPEHLKENMRVFEFTLSAEELAAMDAEYRR